MKKIKPNKLILLPIIALALLLLAVALRPKQAAVAPNARLVRQVLPNPKITDFGRLSYWRDEEVQEGDTLPMVLARIGVSEQNIQDFVQNSPINLKALKLNEGKIVSARIDENQNVTDIQFFNDEGETTTLPSLRSVVITSSVSGALGQAGVPIDVRITLKEIFADKINLDKLPEGSSVRVLYESLYFRGQEVATGNVLAAEVTANNRTYYAYYFENGDADNGGNYYDENGEPLRQGFGGLPIESYTRISSPFGIRVHPITHTVRMHTGIDYAAPQGTRVLAPSDGVVSFRGWKGGYGNAIMLTHDNGMETLYGHLSAFISGVDVGTRVNSGAVIGLVGSTGHSTGPHLHYEVRINGQPVNPATVALPTPQLATADRAALQIYRGKVDEVMQAVRGLPVMVSQVD